MRFAWSWTHRRKQSALRTNLFQTHRATHAANQQNRIALVGDDPDNPFVIVLQLSDGKELWRVSRMGINERSWGTPMIHSTNEDALILGPS